MNTGMAYVVKKAVELKIITHTEACKKISDANYASGLFVRLFRIC